VSAATVRDASEDDAPACAAIYAPYVRETAVSFEGEPPRPAQMAERIAAARRTHGWVVLEDDARNALSASRRTLPLSRAEATGSSRARATTRLNVFP